jgi:uncharacterized Fe-S cluster protein YjdI
MNEDLTIFINNNKYDINKYALNHLNIIDFCVSKGYIIPRFCYHSQLSIAGNCRMCLVELSDSIKPIVSCAMLLRPNIKIFTNTSLVKKARENVLEFLLINHPLDCPICDQGGECDLQDQTLIFGNDRGRFYELKKVSFDKNCNFFIKTIMTRCIHCTRCIRFLNDLNLNFELGMLGRGYNMEIGNYIENNINSELASNIIDLCPVGALTSRTYSFKARPWELINFKSFDILDVISSTITISLQGTKVLRILPYSNDQINNTWLTDKSRYFFDSFYFQRISNPYKFSKIHNKYVIINWYNFYKFIFFLKKNLNFLKNLNFFLNLNFLSINDLIFFKSLNNINLIDLQLNNFNNINKKDIYEFRNYLLDKNEILNFIKNDKIVIFFNNYNLRLKNPILNLEFIRSSKFNNNLFFFSINNNIFKNSNLKNLNFMNSFYINFLKGNNYFNLFISKNIKFNNYNFLIFNSINIVNTNMNLFKIFNIKSFYLPSNLFELNRLEFNLEIVNNSNNFKNINYLNIVLEDNLYLNNFLYKKILNNFIFNIFFSSHNLYHLNLNNFKLFDFILPLNLFIENYINTYNLYGIYQKSYRINNWFKNSKSLIYFLKFLILNLNIRYNKNIILNFNNLVNKKIKFYKNNSNFFFFKHKTKIINWFNQNIYKNIYIINNLTNNSLNLNKNIKNIKNIKIFKI